MESYIDIFTGVHPAEHCDCHTHQNNTVSQLSVVKDHKHKINYFA